MVKQAFLCVVAVAALAACGGKKASTIPDETGDSDMEPAVDSPSDDTSGSGTMVPPEKMEEITRMLERKQRIVSRCLADAVEREELPPSSRGKMTLEIVISPAGRAETVKVLRSVLQSKTLEECVINHVREIQFPTLPKTYPTSYTYAFEAS